jgi:hypothetical protein
MLPFRGTKHSASRWNAVGYHMFLYIAQWFACGIGGLLGNIQSSDIVTHNLV